MEEKKKKSKGKLIVGLLPFVIYLLLAILPAGLAQEVTYIYAYFKLFIAFCVFFWPSTIIGIIFIIWYIFSKKDQSQKNDKYIE